MAYSLVMAVCRWAPRCSERRESELMGCTPPRSRLSRPPIYSLFAVENVLREILTISGADWSRRRGSFYRLHTIFANQSYFDVSISEGIVKQGCRQPRVVMTTELHLPENTVALHPLFEHFQRLIDIVCESAPNLDRVASVASGWVTKDSGKQVGSGWTPIKSGCISGIWA